MSENLKERLKAKARHNMEFVTIGLYSLSPDDAAEVVADWLESEAAGRELLASAPQSLTDDARRWQEVFRHTADAKVIRALAQSLKGGE